MNIHVADYDEIEVGVDGIFVLLTVPEPETQLDRAEALALIAALQACVDELPEGA